MGTDIHVVVQKNVNGVWKDVETPPSFEFRNYGLFGWLADIRNYSAIKPLEKEPKGKPEGWEELYPYEGFYPSDPLDDCYNVSWFSIKELKAIDFQQQIEDRRCMINNNGGSTCEPGKGTIMTLKDFLGESFVNDLLAIDADRIVFGFDS